MPDLERKGHQSVDEGGLDSERVESLPDWFVSALIAAVGNGEMKAVLYSLMSSDEALSKTRLHSLLLESQGGETRASSEGWVVTRGTVADYCDNSLVAGNLVEERQVDSIGSRKARGYAQTKLAEFGLPLSGLMLEFSEQLEKLSLRDIWGDTKTASKTDGEKLTFDGYVFDETKRSSEIRLKLYWELITSELPLRTIDLATACDESPFLIGKHLGRLSKLGIVTYEVAEYGGNISFYRLPQMDAGVESLSLINPVLSEEMFTVMARRQGGWFTIREVVDGVTSNPGRSEQTYLYEHVDSILNSYFQQGYLEKGEFGYGMFSKVSLRPEQLDFIVKLLSVIEGFQNLDPDVLEEGRARVGEIISDPDRVTALLRKARLTSPEARAIPQEEHVKVILDLFCEGERLRSSDICSRLENQGVELTPNRVRRLLGVMIDQGSLSVDRLSQPHEWTLSV